MTLPLSPGLQNNLARLWLRREPPAASAETWRSLDDEGLYATRGWLGDSTPMIFIVQKELDEKRDGYEREKIGAGLGCPLGLWPFVRRCPTRSARKCSPGPMCASRL